MRTGNLTENTTNLFSKVTFFLSFVEFQRKFSFIFQTVYPPPSKILHEYLRCRQRSSIYGLPSNNKTTLIRLWISDFVSFSFSLSLSSAPYSCPYDYDEDLQICWKATENGSFATATIEYDHGLEQYYDGVRFGLENCSSNLRCIDWIVEQRSFLFICLSGTIERFCQMNGSWASPVSTDIQCKTCLGDGRPVKVNRSRLNRIKIKRQCLIEFQFNSISIMIETMSLSLSLLSLTVAVFCMINVK